MPKYMVLYRAPVSAADQIEVTSPEDGQAVMQAWMAWAGKVGPALVDMGSPLASSGSVGAAPGDGLPVAGYAMLEAESADAVAGLLDGHPHLAMDGASIEYLEYLPIPGM